MSNDLIPYSDVEKMGKNIAESGLFGVKTAQQAVALMLVAQALGKHPALAAMDYNIIQGRPAKKADAMLSDFQYSGGKIEWHELTDNKADATFSHPHGGSLRLNRDIDRAKKAGLYEKDGSMYKKYPRSMLRARLIAEGVRTIYPAATGGMRAEEEFDEPNISEAQVDRSKSRLENIIEAQAEPSRQAQATEVKQDEPKKPEERPVQGDIKRDEDSSKKSAAKPKTTSGSTDSGSSKPNITKIELKEGEKLAQGTIQEVSKISKVDKDGKETPKVNIIMDGQKYGIFLDAPENQKMFEAISDVFDIGRKSSPIVVNIVYKERVKGDKTFMDIVRFSQATLSKVPI